MELYAGIRRAVMVDGLSRREAAKRFGVHRNTISKMPQFSVPPGYRAWSDLSSWTGKPTAWKKVEEVLRHVHRSCLASPIPRPAVGADACCEGLLAEDGT